MPGKKALRVLHVEDEENDTLLLRRHLQQNGYDVTCLRVEDADAMRAALAQPWDLVVSDFSMPQFSAPKALAVLKDMGIDIPFIIVSGTVDDEMAVDAMRAGAHDFLAKGKLARLIPAIERELREASMRGERRKMQEQLLIADRMASVGTLAAGVAHEINNPLAALVANLDLTVQLLIGAKRSRGVGKGDSATVAALDTMVRGMDELDEPLRDAREAADRVREIVKDLRIFSRSDEESRRPVDVHRVMESTLRMAWNEIRHRARLVKNYGDTPLVDGNESRLGQVFLNLIVNAAQAIPEGDTARQEIRVTTSCVRGDRVAIEVRDTGSGIPESLRTKIFDPFFTTKPAGVGTGLGLAICHRIISGMNGTIEVESEMGKGTLFRVTLPVARGEQAEITPIPSIAVAARRGRILVVDDEPMMGSVMRRMLSAEHDVTSLTSARAAQELITAGERYDVILSDLMMPEITGMDLYETLVKIAPEQAERIVFMTGGAFTGRARDFLNKVRNPRVDKPFDLNTLRALIHSLTRAA
jgi:signal transduction histidine kinase